MIERHGYVRPQFSHACIICGQPASAECHIANPDVDQCQCGHMRVVHLVTAVADTDCAGSAGACPCSRFRPVEMMEHLEPIRVVSDERMTFGGGLAAEIADDNVVELPTSGLAKLALWADLAPDGLNPLVTERDLDNLRRVTNALIDVVVALDERWLT